MELHDRQRWMGVLARAGEPELCGLYEALDAIPDYEMLRGPETGLVMVRGRAGGSGDPFNMGEMTVTRCSVRLESGGVGHAYVQGRRPDHARRAAVLDAMLQNEQRGPTLMEHVITPLEREEARRREQRARESAATKVDFFTLVRGEDE